MHRIAILLLAAGSSSRMLGRDKLMEQIDDEPLIARVSRRAALTGLPCYITLPSLNHPRADWIGTAIPVPVANAAEGMAASIRTGVAALADEFKAVMILPTDLPDLETQDLLHIAARFNDPQGPILRASSSEGTPGHPVLFPQRYFKDLQALTGDVGAREVLANAQVRLVPLPGQHAITDLDTPEAWAAWRANSS